MKKLQEAIIAIKKGEKELGKKLLTEILRTDPNNEVAWLWMSTVVKDSSQRQQCLERALKINPNNQAAQRNLALVLKKQMKKSAKPSFELRQDSKSIVTTLESSRDPEAVRRNKEKELEQLKDLIAYELSEGAAPSALISRYVRKGYPKKVVDDIVRELDSELEPIGDEMPLSQLFFSTKGRIPRSTYWYFYLGSVLIGLTMLVLDLALGTFNKETSRGLFTTIASLILLIPSYAVAIKRLHDRDRSGWFILVGMIPFVGIWIWIEIGFLKGTYGTNQYGSDPLLQNRHRKIKEYPTDKIPPAS